MLPMLIAYGLFTALVLLIAASAAETILRVLRLPRRWVWVSALLALAVLTAAAPWRLASPAPAVSAVDVPLPSADAPASATVDSRTVIAWDAFAWIVNAPLRLIADLLTPAAADPVNSGSVAHSALPRVLGALWATASVLLLAGMLVTTLRIRSARRTWPLRLVAGEPVRVSRDAGPAVFGAFRPEIVLPAWLLDRPEAEQRMIVAHERAHVDARDPLVLLAACAVVVLFPWNVFAWWMMRRLRLSLEIDCDARVLQAGTTALPYARVLLAAAERRSTLRVLSAALADSPSDLERRLDAMNARPGSHPLVRATGGALAAVTLVLAACEADLPTSAAIDEMSVADAVEAASPVAPLADALYIIDGVEADAAAAHALAPEKIASIVIRKGESVPAGTDAAAVVEISTRDGARTSEILADHVVPDADDDGSVEVASTPAGFNGLLLVDGKRTEPTALRTLDPAGIESIEVIKGAAAARIFDEPEARNGVISIRLKPTPR